MPGEVNILLAVPSTLGAALLFSALLFQLCFLIYRIDTGPVARLQQYSTWSAAIAVIGHVVNAYRFYSKADANSSGWCLTEAITTCFGELALVLWQTCTALTVFITMRPDLFRDAELVNKIYLGFHAFVWIPSLVTTIVPLCLGVLGLNFPSTLRDDDTSYWCWFKTGNAYWEHGQFYFPLFGSSFICIVTFIIVVRHIRAISAQFANSTTQGRLSISASSSPASTSSTSSESSCASSSPTSSSSNALISSSSASSERDKQQERIFRRLAIQLFVLTLVFLPDAIAYYLDRFEHDVSENVFRVTTFIWKCESWTVALLWYSNRRVQDAIASLPFIRSLLSFCRETCCSCCLACCASVCDCLCKESPSSADSSALKRGRTESMLARPLDRTRAPSSSSQSHSTSSSSSTSAASSSSYTPSPDFSSSIPNLTRNPTFADDDNRNTNSISSSSIELSQVVIASKATGENVKSQMLPIDNPSSTD